MTTSRLQQPRRADSYFTLWGILTRSKDLLSHKERKRLGSERTSDAVRPATGRHPEIDPSLSSPWMSYGPCLLSFDTASQSASHRD
ncbi:hypothetical protein CSIM01_13811 [Colletotrichum simmondsii]|uniref:Uncharacterized protein n=1 Tax=Colletotrichum simmondsii TaxID=703756 RepID=A0A135SRU6_9PEZI|nr:hypothetical protein CSIM01_13811 [Colletotrichum simmondsii]